MCQLEYELTLCLQMDTLKRNALNQIVVETLTLFHNAFSIAFKNFVRIIYNKYGIAFFYIFKNF